MSEEEFVTQRLRRGTMARLSKLGKFGETFDELVARLLDKVEAKKP